MPETCPICGDEGEDRRTLRLQCFYAIEEVSPKFEEHDNEREDGTVNRFYTIRVCKNCRGEFLGMLRKWVEGGFINDEFRDGSTERNIPYRLDGRTVMLTREEWEVYRARAEAKEEL